jgi:hypothetical protein
MIRQFSIKRFFSAVVASIIAFIEISFTGRADYSWRIARAENPFMRPAGISGRPFWLFRLISLKTGAGDYPLQKRKPAPENNRGQAVVLFLLLISLIVAISQVGISDDVSAGMLVDHHQADLGTDPTSSDRTIGPAVAAASCLMISVAFITLNYVWRQRDGKKKN